MEKSNENLELEWLLVLFHEMPEFLADRDLIKKDGLKADLR